MGKRKQAGRTTIQLELFPEVAIPAPKAGVWKEIEEFPGKVQGWQRGRRKLLPRRLKQVDVEQLLAQPPHLTPAQADALDDLVICEAHGAQGTERAPLAPVEPKPDWVKTPPKAMPGPRG